MVLFRTYITKGSREVLKPLQSCNEFLQKRDEVMFRLVLCEFNALFNGHVNDKFSIVINERASSLINMVIDFLGDLFPVTSRQRLPVK